MVERIGMLTSGGDAPGMNAAIRSVTRSALARGIDVRGFQRGFAGLMNKEFVELDSGSVGSVLEQGGTMLRTARSPEFREPEGQQQAITNLDDLGVDGMVIIGGDGSLRGARDLDDRWSGSVVGIPASIDNDVAGTTRSIGFDTAINTALELVDRIRDTATSHERTFIVEVMGRNCGEIALQVGLAGGAEEILLPERDFDLNEIADRIRQGRQMGKLHYLVVLAEGAGKGFELADQLKQKIEMETRVAVLGHTQRGGSPSALDRVVAAKMGYFAVEALAGGKTGLSVGLKSDEKNLVSLDEATQRSEINETQYGIARTLSS